MLIRRPHVAGTFYPADPIELKEYCSGHLRSAQGNIPAKAVILPHAGYMYSGKTTCKVLQSPRIPDKVLLIGPNHSAHGAPFSIMSEGEWLTPLGGVQVDRVLAESLLSACDDIRPDAEAHRLEHSLEVELPFLQVLNSNISIIPMVVGTLDLLSAEQVAIACGRWIQAQEQPILVVISTDMSHYESDEITRQKDRYALEAIENLDAAGLVKAVKQHRITMCGFIPVYMLLVMKDLLGIQKATFVDYTTSADASGDFERVVGYAGFIFE